MRSAAMDVKALVNNPIFLSAFMSLCVAQFIKAVISLMKAR